MPDETKTPKKQATLTLAPKAEEASAPDSPAAELKEEEGGNVSGLTDPAQASDDDIEAFAKVAAANSAAIDQGAIHDEGVEMALVEGDTVTGDGSGEAPAPIAEQPNELVLDKEAFLAGFEVEKPEEASIEFVQMVRDPETHPEPHTATVHPAEVENYRLGGWEPAE